jgi:hypothetical protein
MQGGPKGARREAEGREMFHRDGGKKHNWLTLILGTFSTNTYQRQIIFKRMLNCRLHFETACSTGVLYFARVRKTVL